MLDDGRRRFPTQGVIVLGITLLTRLLLFSWWLDHIGFDECWRGHLLLFQFLDARLSHSQLLLRLLQLLVLETQLFHHLGQLLF